GYAPNIQVPGAATPTPTATPEPEPTVVPSAPAPVRTVPPARESDSPRAAKPALFGDKGVVQAPSTRRCASRRRCTVHIREGKGFTSGKARVTVNGKRRKVLSRKSFKRGRHAAVVDLRGLPKGTFKLKITVVSTDGRTVSGTRTYHTCA